MNATLSTVCMSLQICMSVTRRGVFVTGSEEVFILHYTNALVIIIIIIKNLLLYYYCYYYYFL